MVQFFGDFREDISTQAQLLTISFSPAFLPLKKQWRNNGLVANFVADYLVNFLPTNNLDINNQEKQRQLKSNISYIANELLENAMKFHHPTAKNPIELGIYSLENTIILLCTNCILNQDVVSFQSIINLLINNNPQELYIQHLEQLAEDESNQRSGLGFLTILNDYLAKLGWKFTRDSMQENLTMVTVMAQINV